VAKRVTCTNASITFMIMVHRDFYSKRVFSKPQMVLWRRTKNAVLFKMALLPQLEKLHGKTGFAEI